MSRRRLSTALPLRAPVEASNDGSSSGSAPAPAQQAQRRRQSTRKSFGTAYTNKDDDAAAVAGNGAAGGPMNAAGLSAMYTTVIKLSAENKINVKNSWSLPLIDHMETLVMGGQREGGAAAAGAGKGAKAGRAPAAAAAGASDDGSGEPAFTKTGHATVDAAMLNFQRASCALDASVKIYSYRVDDVWSTSYRVLENLSRSEPQSAEQAAAAAEQEDAEGGEGQGDGGDDGEGDDGEEGGGRRRKKAAAVSRRGPSATLERNPASLCVDSLETAFDIDPLFHKMSAEFDAGGTSGMLLHRLPVGAGVSLAFDSTDTPDTDGARGGGFTYALAPGGGGGGGLVPAVGALGAADTAALLAALVSPGGDYDDASGGATDPAAAASALLARLASAGWSASLAGLYDSHDRHAAAAGEAAPPPLQPGEALLPPPPAASAAAGVAALLCALPVHPPAAKAGAASQQQQQREAQAHAQAGAGEEPLRVMAQGEGGGEDEGDRSWAAASALHRSLRRASLMAPPPPDSATPGSPGTFDAMKQRAAAAAEAASSSSGGPPPLLSSLDVSAIDAAVMVVARVAASEGLHELADDDGAGVNDPGMVGDGQGGDYDGGSGGGGYGGYGDGDDDDDDDNGGQGGGLNNTTIIDLASLGLGGAAGKGGRGGKGAAGDVTVMLGAASVAPGAALLGAGGASKHWKFKAAQRKGAEVAAEVEALAAGAATTGEGTDGDADEDAGFARKGLKGAKGAAKGAKGGPFFLDFESDASRPKADAFAKAKRVAAPSSALSRGLASSSAKGGKGAAAAAAAAAGGMPMPPAASFGPRDSEQVTPGALERAAAGGPAAHLTPAALVPSDITTLRGPAHALTASALTLASRPGVAVPVAVVHGGSGDAAPQPGAGPAMGLYRTLKGLRLGHRGAGGGGGGNVTFAVGGYDDGAGGGDDDDDGGDGGAYGYGDGDYGAGEGGAEGEMDLGTGASAAAALAAGAPSALDSTFAVPQGESAEGGGGAAVALVGRARHVERIRVRYETVAKKVDVRALKEAMWAQLEGLAGLGRLPGVDHRTQERELKAAAAAGGGGAGAFVDVTLQQQQEQAPRAAAAAADGASAAGASAGAGGVSPSFAGLIRGLAGQLAGEDAAAAASITVPFYFITVLHLANEHGLALGHPFALPPPTQGHAGGRATRGAAAGEPSSSSSSVAAPPAFLVPRDESMADPLADFPIRALLAAV